MKFLLSPIIAFAMTALFCISAQAASTKWQDLGGGKARLHAIVDPASNRVEGIIEIALEPGWTTYWRYPGSSGIPPHFDFSASPALGAVNVEHPAPTKMGEGMRSYAGYKSQVMFPFSAASKNDQIADINLSMLVGVCEEICIPARATFQIPKTALLQSDLSTMRKLNVARLKIPKPMNPEELSVTRTLRSENILQIEMNTPDGFDGADLFVEGPNEWHLLPAERRAEANGKHIFELDISEVPQDANILEKPLRFTLSNGTTGFEFSH